MDVGQRLAELARIGADRLPLPGHGATLARWQALAGIAAESLPLVKLFEGHTDALAICQELGHVHIPADSLWGTWCAEPPDARLALRPIPGADASAFVVQGTKGWCSGADEVTHAVVSCWDADGHPRLAIVEVDHPGVRFDTSHWQAVGMAASNSYHLHFDQVPAVPLGGPNDYVNRPGFWHGGAGIAACWYGGATGLADAVHLAAGQRADPHRLAHLGAIDVALAGAGAVLRETAAWIDAHPTADAQQRAVRARLVVESAVEQVLHHASRALGAGPLCQDPLLASAFADLPIYLRQSHAQRDLASLGTQCASTAHTPWPL
ncbi:acyl-CoA dehydrogenase family protein [Variovorax ginsengisoli]|uniref:Alkylation response protein AidB-like acyl-CoA dehydrogenase n=1 Tax=Variovorax ginsengisoli TaxID=363844 RepID=A0ABT9S0G9_9BURK|nr:acyl-CoA dehydrogenase family protein [Variovorax ginsengisoli]MDP9897851.1 alkylation response protein AidB-like acyl-CoA dehydrogenase [Variovorax ginsengisoli]